MPVPTSRRSVELEKSRRPSMKITHVIDLKTSLDEDMVKARLRAAFTHESIPIDPFLPRDPIAVASILDKTIVLKLVDRRRAGGLAPAFRGRIQRADDDATRIVGVIGYDAYEMALVLFFLIAFLAVVASVLFAITHSVLLSGTAVLGCGGFLVLRTRSAQLKLATQLQRKIENAL